ncbi:3-phosphoshikimate 1-carboxyvinyltransferase [Nesterenkonia haasae]|uniref:3-phosphoshikimate 1-carboxyvinyltransferase n=1 Tax=Nesterenkonia haasae TaxID=2587813 RepID=UPI002E2B3600|nr:3-phosphoshikimate 1-carboxyvinyltransferase [Nesterenkonia haasae]
MNAGLGAGGHSSGWDAPFADSPVSGEATVPASKSLTNRYLLLAALAEGPSVVVNPLESRDSALMLAALEALGAQVEAITDWEGSGENAVRITPFSPGTGPITVDCGLAGTVMRFLPAVAALSQRHVQFDGDPEARVRPMGAVLDGLRSLGVPITEDGAPGHLPFTVNSPHGLRGGEVTIDASESSQFVSGLLLAASRMPAGLTLHHAGTQVPSLEHVEMTLKVLADLGVGVSSPKPFTWRIEPGPILPFTIRIEPDLSNAGPFLCAAAVTGGEVTMPGWPLESTQIGRRWPQLLSDFGCQVTLAPTSETSGSLTVRGPERLTSPGTVDGTAELTPTVGALAALCSEETKFTSVGHLRGHETNRIAALVNEVRRLGGAAEETDDGFRVLSPVNRADTVLSYADHRMATFGAVLGLAVPGVVVEDIGSTAKTMPDFPDRWSALVQA